jgi:protein gp37
MNATKIEWCEATLNPIVGCPHGCDYCYARKQAKRQKQRCKLCYDFIPHPHLERLIQLSPTQKPKKIFIDSMWDWNASGIKDQWLSDIIDKMRECSQHTFQILSKRPKRYSKFKYPNNVWLGTSVATDADCFRIDQLLQSNSKNIKFVSIEPIHSRINHSFDGLDWIIIGAETGNSKVKIIPDKNWIGEIIERGKQKGIAVFVKENANWPQAIQEFPIS